MPTTSAASAVINKIDISLEGKNSARLAMREYKRDYENLPNSALPQVMRENLNKIYSFISGVELPLTDYTFLIKSRDGKFSRVYSPSVYSNKEDSTLVIKWGEVKIPLSIIDSTLVLPTKNKAKIIFKDEDVNGYKNPVLAISFKDSDNKEMYSMSFPIKKADLENDLQSDELDMFLENNDVQSLMDSIMEVPTGNSSNKDSYVGSGDKLEGFVIKTSALPIGEYKVTGVRRYKNNYGTQHLVQISLDEDQSFETMVSYRDDESGEWVEELKLLENKVIAKANSKLNKLLLSDPLVSEETPASLVILEKGEYNGNPTAKIDFTASKFTVDVEIIDLDF